MVARLIFALSLSLGLVATQAQDRYYSKNGNIFFSSKAPLEDIEAKNKSAVCVLDTRTGSLQFTVLIKGFEFENEEMQEHFNEDYLESNKFPKAEFKGLVTNIQTVNFSKTNVYPVHIVGQLTIHGVTKDVQSAGTIKVEAGGVIATSGFNIQIADYNIKIAPIVKNKIAKTVRITVDTKLIPVK